MITQIMNEPDKIARIKSEHRSLAILRLLRSQPGYRSNDRIVQDWLNVFALSGSQAEIRECLDSLKRLGLIKLEQKDTLAVIEMTLIPPAATRRWAILALSILKGNLV